MTQPNAGPPGAWPAAGGQYGSYGGYVAPFQPRPRRRRWPWVLLIVFVVLVGLAIAADRVALAIAEDKAASTLRNSQHLSSTPDVSVPGFPFLTQAVAGSYGSVTLARRDSG